jgi:hypothetical protein
MMYTMAVIGSADNNASLIFDHSSFNLNHTSFSFPKKQHFFHSSIIITENRTYAKCFLVKN